MQNRCLLSGDQCQLLLFPASKAVLGTRPLEVVSRGCPYNPAVLLVLGWRVGTWVGKAPGTLPSETRLRPPSIQPKWKLLPRDGHLQMPTSRREPAGLWGLRAETGLIRGNYTERFHLGLRRHVSQSKLANRGLPRPRGSEVSVTRQTCESRGWGLPREGSHAGGFYPQGFSKAVGSPLYFLFGSAPHLIHLSRCRYLSNDRL